MERAVATKDMDFADRIKKEMTEGLVRAILEHARYRVIDSGVEKIIREVSCLSALDYLSLRYPRALRKLPDFIVMNVEQTKRYLVEVKYRPKWDPNIFDELKEQVKIFGEIVLVFLNAEPRPTNFTSPAGYLRCCTLKFEKNIFSVELRKGGNTFWTSVREAKSRPGLWWAMFPLQEKFPQIGGKKYVPLSSAIEAISGILNTISPSGP